MPKHYKLTSHCNSLLDVQQASQLSEGSLYLAMGSDLTQSLSIAPQFRAMAELLYPWNNSCNMLGCCSMYWTPGSILKKEEHTYKPHDNFKDCCYKTCHLGQFRLEKGPKPLAMLRLQCLDLDAKHTGMWDYIALTVQRRHYCGQLFPQTKAGEQLL